MARDAILARIDRIRAHGWPRTLSRHRPSTAYRTRQSVKPGAGCLSAIPTYGMEASMTRRSCGRLRRPDMTQIWPVRSGGSDTDGSRRAREQQKGGAARVIPRARIAHALQSAFKALLTVLRTQFKRRSQPQAARPLPVGKSHRRSRVRTCGLRAPRHPPQHYN